MLFLRHDLGVYFNPDAGSAPGKIVHTVNHYFGRCGSCLAPRRTVLVRLSTDCCASPRPAPLDVRRVAGAKAWEGKLWNSPAHMEGQASVRLGFNLHYLTRLDPSPTGEDYFCAEGMRKLRRTAEAHPKARQPKGAYAGARPPRFAIW